MKTKLAFALCLTMAMAGTSALAHAHLKSEAPADKSVVSPAPTALVLTFSEGVSLKFTGVTVTGPGNAAVALGSAALDPKDDTILTVPLPKTLAPGVYSAAWHALSTDGHKTHGTYTFTVK